MALEFIMFHAAVHRLWVLSICSISSSVSVIHFTSVNFLRWKINLPQPSFCCNALTFLEIIIYLLNHLTLSLSSSGLCTGWSCKVTVVIFVDVESGFLFLQGTKFSNWFLSMYIGKNIESGFWIWKTAYKRKPIYFKQLVLSWSSLTVLDKQFYTPCQEFRNLVLTDFCSQIFRITALWSTTSASHTPIMYFHSSRFEAGWPPNRLLQGIVPIDHMSGEDLPYHQPWKQSLSQSGYSCSHLGQSSC